jgi:hypothetical protein
MFLYLDGLAHQRDLTRDGMPVRPTFSAAGELSRKSSVEMRLEGSPVQAPIRSPYELERAPLLVRSRWLHIKPRPADSGMLDVTLYVPVFSLPRETG